MNRNPALLSNYVADPDQEKTVDLAIKGGVECLGSKD
jgi:hypothetical protein